MKKSQFRKGDGEMYEIIWLAALVILLIAEALTCGLTTIWFAGGALTHMSAVHRKSVGRLIGALSHSSGAEPGRG